MPNIRTIIQDICPDLSQFGITYFGHYNLTCAIDSLKIHHHKSNYEINFLDKGTQPYYIHSKNGDIEQFKINGGEIFITRPYELHSTGDSNLLRGSVYWIQLDADCPNLLGQTPQNVRLLKESLSSLNNHVIPVPNAISSRLTEAFSLLCVPDENRIFRACQLLCLFISELAAQNKLIGDSNVNSNRLSTQTLEIISFIETNLLDPNFNIQMIADHLHYSKSYLMTLFRRDAGNTLHNYIIYRKIEYSYELLKKYTVTETAHLLNFSSSQHFSKAFKDHTHMTPSEYLRIYNNENAESLAD